MAWVFQLVCVGGGRRAVSLGVLPVWVETRRGCAPCPSLPQQLCPEGTAVMDPSDAPNSADAAAIGLHIWERSEASEHNWTQRSAPWVKSSVVCGDARAASTDGSGLQGYRPWIQSFGDIGNK